MMTVNLFDNTWRGDPGSTRGRSPSRHRYVRDLPAFDGPTLFVDGFAIWPDQVDSPNKIGWLHEPPCLIPSVYYDIRHNNGRFEKVLTYSAELLAQGGNYAFMPYGGCWIPDDEWGLHPKTKLCSMLIGAKTATDGHRLRHAIADQFGPLGLVDFYGVRGQPVDYSAATKLRVLKDYAFCVVTETCRVDNLFTEWLLDCFAVGTVPIFWGCPNASEFFDADGILPFERPEQCAAIVRELSFERYESRRPAAAANLERMQPFANSDDYLYDHYLHAYAN